MITSLEVFARAIELAGPNGEHVTAHAQAVDTMGHSVDAYSPRAVNWCLIGIVGRARRDLYGDKPESGMCGGDWDLLDDIGEKMGYGFAVKATEDGHGLEVLKACHRYLEGRGS
jgi:hypothetical protein